MFNVNDNVNHEKLSLVESLFGKRWKARKQMGMRNPKTVVKMVAPMVRYSKLPFRMLCRKWGCDLAFTPMIMADPFNKSANARDAEFVSNKYDRPLMVQFASNDPIVFAQASLKVFKYSDGVDINCGCPQRWAVKEQIGAYMIQKPELIKNMIYECSKLTEYRFPISFKIRIHSDIRKTVDLLQHIQSINDSIGANPFDYNGNNVVIKNEDISTVYNVRNVGGLSWMTVHGRTLSERTKVKVHLDHIKTLVQHAKVPIIANGDINLPNDMEHTIEATGADGVMCARGILHNPALFSGYDECPLQCVTDYLSLALQFGGHFPIHHHHLMYMIKNHLTKAEQRDFNSRNSMCAVIDFLSDRGWLDDFNEWNVVVPYAL